MSYGVLVSLLPPRYGERRLVMYSSYGVRNEGGGPRDLPPDAGGGGPGPGPGVGPGGPPPNPGDTGDGALIPPPPHYILPHGPPQAAPPVPSGPPWGLLALAGGIGLWAWLR